MMLELALRGRNRSVLSPRAQQVLALQQLPPSFQVLFPRSHVQRPHSTAESVFHGLQRGSVTCTTPSRLHETRPLVSATWITFCSGFLPRTNGLPVVWSAVKPVTTTVFRLTYRSNPRTQSFRSHQRSLFLQGPTPTTYPSSLAL